MLLGLFLLSPCWAALFFVTPRLLLLERRFLVINQEFPLLFFWFVMICVCFVCLCVNFMKSFKESWLVSFVYCATFRCLCLCSCKAVSGEEKQLCFVNLYLDVLVGKLRRFFGIVKIDRLKMDVPYPAD